MKVLVIGEIYSENLGDGAIAEANRYLLEKYCESEVEFLDISNRNNFVNPKNLDHSQENNPLINNLKSINKVLMRNSSYSSLLFLTILQLKERKKSLNNLSLKVTNVDFALIGGGQLLMDNHLSFPIRLFVITNFLKNNSIPFVFSSIGVSDNWSYIGKKYFTNILSNPFLSRISVRDQLSKKYLNKLYPNKKIDTSIDSAIFVDECFKINKLVTSKTIGLGITNIASLAFGSNGNQDYRKKNIIDMWHEVIDYCIKTGYSVELFTNGSLEDYEFSIQIADEYKKIFKKSVLVAERPLDPSQLVSTIARYKLIIAHRLHSNIIAYSLKIPTIGLGWDPKVGSFGKIINREDFFLKAKTVNAQNIIKLFNHPNAFNFDNEHYYNLKRNKIKYMQLLVRSK